MNDWHEFLKEVARTLMFEQEHKGDAEAICERWEQTAKEKEECKDACDI